MTISWKYSAPRYLHIELSTYCNAACPFCPRFFAGTDKVRSDLNLTQISLDDFKKFFDQESIKKWYKVMFCGTQGDPINAKDCYEIIEYVNAVNPDCRIVVHTNGGVRRSDFWHKMGTLFSRPNLSLIFSIDGLEDTNHIYRRNVQWSALIENVHNFINAGGYAIWEYLVFGHNEHQVDQADQYAKQIGFKEFRAKRALGFDDPSNNRQMTRSVFDREGNLQYKIYPPKNKKYLNIAEEFELDDPNYSIDKDHTKFQLQVENSIQNFHDSQAYKLGDYLGKLDSYDIKCKSYFDHFTEIYVSASGIVFPCCFVGNRYDGNIDHFMDHQLKAKIRPRLAELDLHNRSFGDILAAGVLEEIFSDSWLKDSIRHGKLAYCAETCGQNSPLDKLYVK